VDVILDHIRDKYLKPNLKSLADDGRLVLIGVMGSIKADVNLAMIMVKRQQLIGFVLRATPD
jgi:NADPH2:quinone reductase